MTAIQWTDETWNPFIGCARVSSGCQRCYAEVAAAQNVRRLRAAVRKTPTDRAKATLAAYEAVSQMDANGQPTGRWNRATQFRPECLGEPLKWRKRRMVFVCSMSDLFHESNRFEDIAAVFCVMAACPQHTFQILTKRPERAQEFFSWLSTRTVPCSEGYIRDNRMDRERIAACWEGWRAGALTDDWLPQSHGQWPLPNVWIGTSVETEKAAEARLPWLLNLPAAVRWLSVEPLLGPVNLPYVAFNGADSFGALPGIDWVVVGGESGTDARPCDVEWIRRVVDDCRDAGVPVFAKQLGSRPTLDGAPLRLRDPKGGDPAEWPEDIRVREWPVRRSA